jgi:hypothetical protein
MSKVHPPPQRESLTIPFPEPSYHSSKRMALLIFLLYLAGIIFPSYLMSGCSGPSPHRLQAHFENESHASEVIQGKLSVHSPNRLPVGLAIVLHADSSYALSPITEDTWTQFAARVQREVQDRFPVSMQEVVLVEGIPSGERVSLLKEMGGNSPIEVVLVVLPSGKEVKGPAKFDLLPEVSMLNGYQTENHATVELGLLDLKSGKMLLQSQGSSYATLEQLDVPLASNRYPRVRGSAMINPIYPGEGKALETLRIVALNEALDQAVMKLAKNWPNGQGKSIPAAPS